MSYGSSAPDAKNALVTLLEARPALADVPVRREYPQDPTTLGECIFVGREGGQSVTGQAIIAVAKAAPQVFDESYTLWVTAQSITDTSSGTAAGTTERAWTLAAEIIGTVATSARLGLTDTAARSMFHIGLDADPYEFDETGGFLTSGGYGTRVVVGLHCTARITLS